MIKDNIKTVVKKAVSTLPPTLLLILAKHLSGKFAHYLPPGVEVTMTDFFGDLCVQIDTTFCVERQMAAGNYDKDTARAMRYFVRPGFCCMDIGANVGPLSLLLAKLVGEAGHVFAVEPGPPTFARLKTNIALNPGIKERIIAVNIGLTDKNGILFWCEDKRPAGRGNADLRRTDGIPVAVETVDSFVKKQRLNRLDFVKIDVEGMELEVLRGGVRIWSTLKPILYFETLEGFRQVRGFDTFQEIETLLMSIGYNLYCFTARSKLQPVTSKAMTENTIAIHADMKDR